MEGLMKAIKAEGSLPFDYVIFCPTVPSDIFGNRGLKLPNFHPRSD
jgi:hypothetical protein